MVKKKKEEVDIHRYIFAGIIALLVFSLGLSLGILLDMYRGKWAETVINEQQSNFISLTIQNQLMDMLQENTTESCSSLQALLTSAVIELNKALDKLLEYKKSARINIDEGRNIERQYTLANIRYWLLAREYKERCKPGDLVTILYFFREKCDKCPNQGVILTYYKKKFGERLLVFPINCDLEDIEPSIKILKSYYNITEYPSIVVENETYKGVIEKERLGKIICDSFLEKQPECEELS